MFGRIRELYDRSKFLTGSKLKAEAETIRAMAKKRITLGRAGAFAAGQNFVGKVRDIGKSVFRADLLEVKQPNGVYGVIVQITQDPRTIFAYGRSKPPFNYPPFTHPGFEVDGCVRLPNIANTQRVGFCKPEPNKPFKYAAALSRSDSIISDSLVFGSNGGVVGGSRSTQSTIVLLGGISITGTVNVTYSNGGLTSYFEYDGYFDGFSNDDSDNRDLRRKFYRVQSGWVRNVTDRAFGSTVTTGDLDITSAEQTVRPEYTAWEAEHATWVANKALWDSLEDDRIAQYRQYLEDRADALADHVDLVPDYVIQTNTGDYLFNANEPPASEVLASFVYPDDVAPTSTTSDYQNHIVRHRAWRKAQSDEVMALLAEGVLHVNLLCAIMRDAPHSRIMGIGDRWWIGYVVQQSEATAGAGVGQTITYTRRLRARNLEDAMFEVVSGTCVRTVVSQRGFIRYNYTFDNWPCLAPLGVNAYLRGTYSSLTSPEATFTNPAMFESDGFVSALSGVCVVNGSYDTLYSGISNAAAQFYANYFKELVPAPAAPELVFTEIDYTDLKPDQLTMDEDTDNDGTIESSERTPSSALSWFGKGMSPNELITVFPLSYVADDGECGMFPQQYDIQRLTAIRIYAGYQFRYIEAGQFDFIRVIPVIIDGEEIEYEEFPYHSSLGTINTIVVANGTIYDDVLSGNPVYKKDDPLNTGNLSGVSVPSRKKQAGQIRGAHEADIEEGTTSLNGLYEWCSLLTTQANSSQ